MYRTLKLRVVGLIFLTLFLLPFNFVNAKGGHGHGGGHHHSSDHGGYHGKKHHGGHHHSSDHGGYHGKKHHGGHHHDHQSRHWRNGYYGYGLGSFGLGYGLGYHRNSYYYSSPSYYYSYPSNNDTSSNFYFKVPLK
ncbi:hypothetical protein [Candidatus Protochlamydia sp. W-9]|uniref:hypothetical protein n=1 Tax=Candidatus Protochlamydia sp. W-9 TaxID=1785087 RepID=UPI00096A6D01|nr:hypothetical protein [Candidatus Protochlamydia sp. W-9]